MLLSHPKFKRVLFSPDSFPPSFLAMTGRLLPESFVRKESNLNTFVPLSKRSISFVTKKEEKKKKTKDTCEDGPLNRENSRGPIAPVDAEEREKKGGILLSHPKFKKGTFSPDSFPPSFLAMTGRLLQESFIRKNIRRTMGPIRQRIFEGTSAFRPYVIDKTVLLAAECSQSVMVLYDNRRQS
ncbi:hypothetical protein CEXT_798591 [Caerostris extrusa]|uniref:Uncharacterized protein n=1 Tax=Caerostris extrusa TaxID=172846 RepID=A0AAV4Q1P5_CAEEX|nr:hypothetical protein CEXT_798591 [Caerostris extrusa]